MNEVHDESSHAAMIRARRETMRAYATKEPILEPSHFASLDRYKCRAMGCGNSVHVPADAHPTTNIPLCWDCQEKHDDFMAARDAAQDRQLSWENGFIAGGASVMVLIGGITCLLLWLY